MIYLDNAATSYPKPKSVYSEVVNCMKSYAANPGRSSHNLALNASSKVAETREEISKLFNIDNPLNIVFTSNATEGLNIAIKGLLKPSDHVISTVIEHNSVLRPLKSATNHGVEVTLLRVDEEGKINFNALEREVRKNTKAVIINHASNVLGTVQHIEKIGNFTKSKGIFFLVDASQSAGVIPIDVKKCNIDLLAFPGHKGLLGLQGTGGLYIGPNIDIDFFIEGGTGSNSNSMEQPKFLPDKFESGTLNTPGIAGLCEGIKFIKKIGIKNIEKHELMLTEQLLKELNKLSFVKIYGPKAIENRTSVVSINIIGMDSSKVSYILNKNNIAVRDGYHCAPLIHEIIKTKENGTVRISPGYFNTHKDIEAAINVLKKIND